MGSVISVGMLNQHLAISTEGMELGGLWDQWWPPRRDTGGTGVTQQCLAVEGAIPVAGNTGGKLVAQHPIPVCCSRTNSSSGSLRCHFGNRTLPSCSPKEKNPSCPPFPAWILHSQHAQALGCPSILPAVPGQPSGLDGCHQFPGVGKGRAGSPADPASAPRLITAISLPVPPPRCLPPASVCCLVL